MPIIGGGVLRSALTEEAKSMLNSKMKKLALGLSAAVAMMWSASANAQDVLEIAAEPVFANQALDFGFAFEEFYFTNHNIDYSFGEAVEGGAEIKADLINGKLFADLYFSATPEIPKYLARHYPKLVVGRPFTVAMDSLELYSPSVDISAGLPFALTTTFAIPDPTQDNFGAAAFEVISQWPWRIPASLIPAPFKSIPGSFVLTYPSEGQTFSAIRHGRVPYGFIPRSEVCSYNVTSGTSSYPDGSFHHEYKPFGRHPYNPELVTVTAIRLAKNRTALQEQALDNYVAFLTGAKDTFGNVVTNKDGFTSGQDVLRSYCLKIPPRFGWEAADLDH
jgi:molybdate transport system substrate-binding protein